MTLTKHHNFNDMNKLSKLVFLQKNLLTALMLMTSLLFVACDEMSFTTDPAHTLRFSTDTLTFDTVFTTVGSATTKMLVYNRNNKAINISSIRLSGGKNSSFRINVDGSRNENHSFENIEISAKDSMYVFVEVTIDPNNANSPVLVEDSLVFVTNGVSQRVTFHAFGQDMVLLREKLILNDTTLNADKPYLVYGYLAIDTAKTLTLNPGTKLYFHNNANLLVYGHLKAQGTAEQPIVMRGDRMDNIKFETPVPYNYVAGQWGGVYLLWNHGNHTFNHVVINSGYVGVYFVNNDRSNLPNLEISNSRLHNFVYYGLVAQNGNLKVSNTEISNSGSYTVYLNGGKHSFVHSTIANYYNFNNFQAAIRDGNPAVMMMNLYRNAPMQTEFINCVIAGSLDNELALATRYPEHYKGLFTNCYIGRSDTLKLNQFSNIRWKNRNDTVFAQTRFEPIKNLYFNFSLDSVSPARGIADPVTASQYPYDLNGNSRFDDGAPDAGAYEWKSTY